jgi:hypothetical protein
MERHVVAIIDSVHSVDCAGEGPQTLVQVSSRRESVDEFNNPRASDRREFPEVPCRARAYR